MRAADAAADALYGAVPEALHVAVTDAVLSYCHDPDPGDDVMASARATVALAKVTGWSAKEAVAFMLKHGALVRAYADALRQEAEGTGVSLRELFALQLLRAERHYELTSRVSAFRQEVLAHRIRQLQALQGGASPESVGPRFAPADLQQIAEKHGLAPAAGTAAAFPGEWVLAEDPNGPAARGWGGTGGGEAGRGGA